MSEKNIDKRKKKHNEIFRKYGLRPFRKIITSECLEKVAKETIKCKMRKRIFTFEVTFWMMMTVGVFCESMRGSLKKSWDFIRPLFTETTVLPASEAAFTKARKRLPLNFFKKVYEIVLNYFREDCKDEGLWKGHRLKIIDGLTINLPESKRIRKVFGSRKNQNKESTAPVQAHFIGLFWAFIGICEGFAIGSLRLGEKTGLLKLIKFLKGGDLLLADRGFPGYETNCEIPKKQHPIYFRHPDILSG